MKTNTLPNLHRTASATMTTRWVGFPDSNHGTLLLNTKKPLCLCASVVNLRALLIMPAKPRHIMPRIAQGLLPSGQFEVMLDHHRHEFIKARRRLPPEHI
jgi:hypothetical protein